jgi:hypothetical protein
MAMHDIQGIVDIERHRGGRFVIATATRPHHGPASACLDLDRDPAGGCEGGIAAQMFEVMGIFVAAGDALFLVFDEWTCNRTPFRVRIENFEPPLHRRHRLLPTKLAMP